MTRILTNPTNIRLEDSESHGRISRSPMRYACIGFLLVLVCASSAKGQLLDYGSYSGYGIRKGILGNDYENPRAACIAGTESTLNASNSAIRVSIVSSADEYKQAFHIDQKAEATFLGIAGGGEELHFGQENSGSTSAFDIIVEAYGEHDAKTVDSVTWNEPYKTMLDSGNASKIQQVREACGDRYIQTVFYETRLFVVMHVSKQQSSSLTTFSGSAHGKVDLDIVSATASLGGDANVKSAHTAGAITITVYTEGFGDTVALTDAALGIAAADGIADIAGKLGAYLKTLNAVGQPVKYRLASLPLLPTHDLSDAQIFEYLKDLKSKYFNSYWRTQNVRALMMNSDPRRLIFKQPAADLALKKQLDLLTQYSNTVAKAHDGCRKAADLDACKANANAAGDLPALSSVELQLAVPPLIGPYFFAIDGTPVAPGQNMQLFASSGITLLEAARALKPNASNVDVMAIISGAEFLSSVDMAAVAPQPPYPPLVVGVRSLLGQELRWPTYWTDKESQRYGVPIHFLHADAQHPCKILNSGGLNFIEESCLTDVGRVLRQLVRTDVAEHVSAQPPTTYDFAIMGVPTTCYAPPGVPPLLPLGIFHLVINTDGGNRTARVGFFLPMITVSLPLIEYEESHDQQTWTQQAQSRVTELLALAHNTNGPNPCIPHIP